MFGKDFSSDFFMWSERMVKFNLKKTDIILGWWTIASNIEGFGHISFSKINEGSNTP